MLHDQVANLAQVATATAFLLIVIAACSKQGRFVGIGALLILGVSFVIGW